MAVKQTIQTIPEECLLKILKMLCFYDCLSLRSTCFRLKNLVEDYFQVHIRTLPVVLTAPYKASFLEEYEDYMDGKVFYAYWHRFEWTQIGSNPHQLEFWEDEKFLQEQKDFRLKDFLIVYDIKKINEFFLFIAKYFPNITKLAVIIDHQKEDFLNPVQEIIDLYQEQLEVLLLEKTARSGFELTEYPASNLYQGSYVFKLPEKFRHCLESLPALKKLSLFPNNSSKLTLSNFPESDDQKFLQVMLGKLKAFHVNSIRVRGAPWFYFSHKKLTNHSIEEISCQSDYCFKQLISGGVRFHKLKKVVFVWRINADFMKLRPNFAPNLREICFHQPLTIFPPVLKKLKKFRNLEKISCLNVGAGMKKYKRKNEYFNDTLKYIETDTIVDCRWTWYEKRQAIVDGEMKCVRDVILHKQNEAAIEKWAKYFRALKRIEIRSLNIEVIRLPADSAGKWMAREIVSG